MTTSASEAQKTFTAAEKKLHAAVAEYGQARKALHSITGQFVGTDENALQRFSSSLGIPSDPQPADKVQTDC